MFKQYSGLETLRLSPKESPCVSTVGVCQAREDSGIYYDIDVYENTDEIEK